MLIFIYDFIQNHDRLFINNSLNIFISSSAVSPERDLNVKFCERTYTQLHFNIVFWKDQNGVEAFINYFSLLGL